MATVQKNKTRTTKRKMHAALTSSLPGEGAIAPELVDQAVVDLNRIYVTKGFETARAVADYVVHAFFDGDPQNFRDRGNGHVSFRQLAKRDDLRVGWQFIWNAVAVVEQLDKLPSGASESLPLSHHKLLLAVKDDDQKKALAEAAVQENLGKRELEDRVKAARKQNEVASKAGRPPLPGFVKAFTALKKVVKAALADEVSEASFEHFTRDEARLLLTEMEAHIKQLAEVAGRVRAHVGA